MSCFGRENIVYLQSGSAKNMENIVVGDRIMALDKNHDIIYSKVKSLIFDNKNNDTYFLKYFLSNNEVLIVSEDQLVYKENGYDRASNIKVGDKIKAVVDNKLSSVEVIDKSIEIYKGYILPLTSEGNIIVNSVICSCYNFKLPKNILEFVTREDYRKKVGNSHEYFNMSTYLFRKFPSEFVTKLIGKTITSIDNYL